MGFGVPAAIGAKAGRPDRTVWTIDGDGCFQMTAQELVTARSEGIPIKVAILNNAYLGMVRQWQEMFYDERYSEVYLSSDLPDYVKWAEAMGCVGLRATNVKEMDDDLVVGCAGRHHREDLLPGVGAEVDDHRPVIDGVGLVYHRLHLLGVLDPEGCAAHGLGPLDVVGQVR